MLAQGFKQGALALWLAVQPQATLETQLGCGLLLKIKKDSSAPSCLHAPRLKPHRLLVLSLPGLWQIRQLLALVPFLNLFLFKFEVVQTQLLKP